MNTARKLEIVEENASKPSKRHEIAKKTRKDAETVIEAEKMLEYLKEGNILEASKIKMKIENVLDPASLEGYEDAVKECMRLTVAEDEDYTIDSMFVLKSDFGEGIDFRGVEGYEEIVKKAFFDYLEQEWYLDALNVKDKLGAGIDFSKIKGYEKTVKRNFSKRINYFEMEEAFDVIENFGEDIDFSEEIKKAFKYLLKNGFPIEAGELEKELGTGLGLRSVEGYEKAVQQGIRSCLKDYDENAAVLMESNFGSGKVTPLFGRKTYEEEGNRGRKAV